MTHLLITRSLFQLFFVCFVVNLTPSVFHLPEILAIAHLCFPEIILIYSYFSIFIWNQEWSQINIWTQSLILDSYFYFLLFLGYQVQRSNYIPQFKANYHHFLCKAPFISFGGGLFIYVYYFSLSCKCSFPFYSSLIVHTYQTFLLFIYLFFSFHDSLISLSCISDSYMIWS